MAFVEPLIGHLLSKYRETVLEGLSKIRNALQANDEQGTALATAITQQEEAMQAIRATLLKSEYFVPTTQTLTAVLTHLPERGSRVALVREVLHGDCAALFRKTLATLSDMTLSHVIAALQFLTAAVKDAPLLVLSRLRSPAEVHSATAGASSSTAASASAAPRRADVPLHLAAFRLQLTYGQRRIRLVRLGFLVQLITAPMHNAVAETVCSHGVLTHLLEDAAELLREGTSAGVACSMDALRVVRECFVQSRDITAEQKRRVLLAQRNIFRLLVRALEFDPVADHAAAILYAIVDETIESPADYASTRVESLEDHGMPNYLLFFLLRQLRPKANERMAELVLHILQRAPDLIRPYFIRVSGHLAEESNTHGVAPTTARVAVINLMTRAFLCPMPYHLAAVQVRLEPVAAKTATFYAMCPRDVADEICPAWVAEYIHRLINGSTNLLLLTLAMQMTQAALMRAKRVLPLVQAAQRAAEWKSSLAAAAAERGYVNSVRHGADNNKNSEKDVGEMKAIIFSSSDLAALHGSDDAEAEVWDTFNAQVRHHVQAALPSREEFWHRMTQQVHHSLTTFATAQTDVNPAANEVALTKVHVVTQRILLLMKSYVDVLDLRVPWLSAVPTFLPDFKHVVLAGGASPAKGDHSRRKALEADKSTISSLHPITAALQQQNDVLRTWPSASVVMLCELLITSHQRRVPMAKLHHINMCQAHGIGEWPLLLSILLWATHHHSSSSQLTAQTASESHAMNSMAVAQDVRAVGWAAQLLLWTVHSVTIHSTCTLAEAYVWLSCLTPNTVPLLLHVLNHLLMRSLSKAADRVTQELREASFGVLVAAAQHFVERTKEKQQQQQQESTTEATDDTAAAVGRTRGSSTVKPQKGKSATKADRTEEREKNLWGTHLQSALHEFEGVIEHVKQLWPQRDTVLREAAACFQSDSAARHVTQQQCIDVLVLADRERGFAKVMHQASTSTAQQLRSFVRTLHSPVLPLPEDEAQMALLSQLHGVTGARSDVEVDTADEVRHIRDVLCLSDAAAVMPCWYVMSSVCWHVAGRLLVAVEGNTSASVAKATNDAHVRALALALVRSLLAHRSEVEATLSASTSAQDASTTGLLVLLLVCLRVLLRTDATTATTVVSVEAKSLSLAEGKALGLVCLSSYTGSLSVQDRLRYAVCLSLHYLLYSSASTEVAAADPQAAATSDDAVNGVPPVQHPPRRGVAVTYECRGDVRAGTREKDAVRQPQRFVFHGAAVPEALVQRRFFLAGHTASAFRTAEVEMLSWHLDTLTDDDVIRMALCASSRLHNGLVVRRPAADVSNRNRRDTVVDSAEDVLCAVYPELQGMEDVDVANLERLTSSDLLDLRYIVPLLYRVAALPPAHLEHLPTGRVIPLLLKGLASVDVELRTAAAAALAHLYIPKGALRIVVGVARLKLRQLADAAEAAGGVVPRLPTPLTVFLITAIRPLSRYEDALHHHLLHFLLHIDAALAAPVPFVQWITTPPLTAVSVPLMLERQEALQQRTHKLGGGVSGSGIAQASAADVAQELRKSIPPQLDFVLRLLRHACEVPQDAASLLESDSVSGLMLLCDLLTASDAQRATYVRCLLDLCTQSAILTRLLAQQGNALVWTVSFLWELCKEYGVDTPHPYSGLTFTAALKLQRVLCLATLPSSTPEEAACVSAASIDQLGESLRQLRAWVVSARVTARDILDAFDEMIAWCANALRSRDGVASPTTATVAAEQEGAAKEEETPTSVLPVAAARAATNHGKRRREKALPVPKRAKAEHAT
jgi:hypothetical protein